MVDKVSRARKKELEQPDPFMESMQAVGAYCAKHKKQVIWISSIVVAVILVLSGVIYSIRSAEKNASTLLAETLSRYTDTDPVKGYDAVKEDFKKILDKYSNTAAGRLARIDFAAISYNASKFNTAHALYLHALGDFKDDPAMENLLLVSLGHTCQAEKKYDEAEKYFSTIVQGTLPFLKAEALFNLGLIKAAKGDKKGSLKMFKQIVAEYADSMYKPLAENRIINGNQS